MAPAIVWDAVAVSPERDALLLSPRLESAAIRERLDATVGVAGWSVTYQALPGDAVACHVRIGEVTKAGVATAHAALDGVRAAERAFALAAAAFGIVVAGSIDLTPRWVACDPVTLVVAPDPWDAVDPALNASPEDDSRDELIDDAPFAVPDRSDDESTASAEAIEPTAPVEPAEATAPAEDAEGKSAAQRIIDRLIERLKEQGQGLAAARILVRHGGYGRDPVAARELYAELRALLLAGRRES